MMDFWLFFVICQMVNCAKFKRLRENGRTIQSKGQPRSQGLSLYWDGDHDHLNSKRVWQHSKHKHYILIQSRPRLLGHEWATSGPRGTAWTGPKAFALIFSFPEAFPIVYLEGKASFMYDNHMSEHVNEINAAVSQMKRSWILWTGRNEMKFRFDGKKSCQNNPGFRCVMVCLQSMVIRKGKENGMKSNWVAKGNMQRSQKVG